MLFVPFIVSFDDELRSRPNNLSLILLCTIEFNRINTQPCGPWQQCEEKLQSPVIPAGSRHCPQAHEYLQAYRQKTCSGRWWWRGACWGPPSDLC